MDNSKINLAIDSCVAGVYPHNPLKLLPIPEVNIKAETIAIVIHALKIWYLNWLKKKPLRVLRIEYDNMTQKIML